MRIRGCIPMSWKMLCSGDHTIFLHAANESTAESFYNFRGIAIGTKVNNWIIGIAIHIHDWCKSNVNTYGSPFLGGYPPLLVRQSRGVGSCQSHIGRKQGSAIEKLTHTPLIVSGDEQR